MYVEYCKDKVVWLAHHIVGDVAVGCTGDARVGHLNAGRVDAGVHVSHMDEHALAVTVVAVVAVVVVARGKTETECLSYS